MGVGNRRQDIKDNDYEVFGLLSFLLVRGLWGIFIHLNFVLYILGIFHLPSYYLYICVNILSEHQDPGQREGVFDLN